MDRLKGLSKFQQGLLALYGWMVVSWIIMLSGVAASMSYCVDIREGGGAYNVRGHRMLLSSSTSNAAACGNEYAFSWWTLWFQALCVSMAIMASHHRVMSLKLGSVTVVFFVISTTILMIVAQTTNDRIFANKDSDYSKTEKLVDALRASMAGFVMSLIANIILIALVVSSVDSPFGGGLAFLSSVQVSPSVPAIPPPMHSIVGGAPSDAAEEGVIAVSSSSQVVVSTSTAAAADTADTAAATATATDTAVKASQHEP